jgi:hypothetical protein
LPHAHVVATTEIERTARVKQVEALFDVPPAEQQQREWDVDLDLADDWQVGLIVGPSGSGKTRAARALWPDALVAGYQWSDTAALVDGFPDLGIKAITGTLAGVGLGSIPAWLRAYQTLSTGEQFRATLADERAHGFVIHGPAGVGKTRLAEELRRIINFPACETCTVNGAHMNYTGSQWLPKDTPPVLPDRVLELLDTPATDSIRLRLLETNGSRIGYYIALSHRWGGDFTLKTTNSTLSQRLKDFCLEDLPRTFRDTVLVAKALGIMYLWIDSLCIIQDDRKDWLEQSTKMGSIYMNSTFTIAVSALRFLYTVTLQKDWRVDHIPHARNPQRLPVVLSPEEVVRFLESVKQPKPRTILTTTSSHRSPRPRSPALSGHLGRRAARPARGPAVRPAGLSSPSGRSGAGPASGTG